MMNTYDFGTAAYWAEEARKEEELIRLVCLGIISDVKEMLNNEDIMSDAVCTDFQGLRDAILVAANVEEELRRCRASRDSAEAQERKENAERTARDVLEDFKSKYGSGTTSD